MNCERFFFYGRLDYQWGTHGFSCFPHTAELSKIAFLRSKPIQSQRNGSQKKNKKRKAKETEAKEGVKENTKELEEVIEEKEIHEAEILS